MKGQLSAEAHSLLTALMALAEKCAIDGPYDALYKPSRPFLDQLAKEGVITAKNGINWWTTLHGSEVIVNFDEGYCCVSRLYIDPLSGATRHG